MEQVVEDGTLQACALKRLRYTTPGQRAAAHQETAALGALLGVAHIAQLVHADCYREPDTKQWSWALIMKYALPPSLPLSSPSPCPCSWFGIIPGAIKKELGLAMSLGWPVPGDEPGFTRLGLTSL